MTKSYADQCLERAEKAIKGVYRVERLAFDGGDFAYEINDEQQLVQFYEHDFKSPMKAKFAAELYAHAGTDIIELAMRLKRAIEIIVVRALMIPNSTHNGESLLSIVAELEAMPEEKG